MASIGLKVNHDQFGTALAGTLAKAMTTNASDAIAIEKMKSDLLTGEMQRRLLHEQTTGATQAAIAQAKENQYKQAIFNAQTDMAGPMGKVLLAQQFQPEEVPAIVQESGGRGMPESLVPLAPQVSGGRGIPEHLVPLADDMPVPVEPQISGGRGVPEALVPMYPSETQVSGGRGMPESLVPTYPSAVQESGGRGMPEFRVPLAPEPVQPLVGAAPGPNVVASGENPLIDLFGTEQPEVIADMLAGMENPAVAGAPAAPTELPPVATLTTPPVGPEGPVPVELPAVASLTTPPAAPDRVVPDMPAEAMLPPEAVSTETTAAVPGTPPTGTLATPPAAPTLPAAGKISTKPPGSVGSAIVKEDGSVVYMSDEGPIPLTADEANKLALGIAYGNDPAGQLGKLSGILKVTYGDTTLTPNQKAEILNGIAPIGTEEETASKIAVQGAKPEFQMVEDRLYEVTRDANGQSVATLVPGQPAPGEVNPFGDSLEGNMTNMVVNLGVNKPDPATWTPVEKLRYAVAVEKLYGSEVKVTESGKIIDIGGKLPPGVLPGTAGYTPGKLPPPTATPAAPAAAAAAATPAAPAATAPAAPAVAPTAPAAPAGTNAPIATTETAPATAAPEIGTDGGHAYEVIDGVKVKNYGGRLNTGESPKETVSDVGGRKITQVESTGPTEMDNAVRKEFNATRNVLTPGKYMLDVTPDKVPNVLNQVIQNVASNNSLLQTLASTTLSAPDREYFQQIQHFINAVTHKASGADVTAADLRTYGYLFSLPPKEVIKPSDLRVFKNRVLEDIRNSRTGWNGAVPSNNLREFDIDIARAGLDLDKVYTDEDAAGPQAPADYKED